MLSYLWNRRAWKPVSVFCSTGSGTRRRLRAPRCMYLILNSQRKMLCGVLCPYTMSVAPVLRCFNGPMTLNQAGALLNCTTECKHRDQSRSPPPPTPTLPHVVSRGTGAEPVTHQRCPVPHTARLPFGCFCHAGPGAWFQAQRLSMQTARAQAPIVAVVGPRPQRNPMFSGGTSVWVVAS